MHLFLFDHSLVSLYLVEADYVRISFFQKILERALVNDRVQSVYIPHPNAHFWRGKVIVLGISEEL